MNSEKLTHLIYASAVSQNFIHSDLEKILQIARSRNSQLSVTGMLLFTSGSFFQVLEGEDTILTELFAKIMSDPRHIGVTKIIHEPIEKRDFADWTMGYSEIKQSELDTLEGLNDFFKKGNSLTDLQPGRAKKLLLAFTQGRWRTRLKG